MLTGPQKARNLKIIQKDRCVLYFKAVMLLSDYDTGEFPITHRDFDTHSTLFRRDSTKELHLAPILDWGRQADSELVGILLFPCLPDDKMAHLGSDRRCILMKKL